MVNLESDEWLSLSEVAGMLGVHPSTVRLWSDQGHLPVHRTQGGHRRYRRYDVDLWLKSQSAHGPDESNTMIQNVIKRTRFEIGEGRLEAESWYQKVDNVAREQYRRSGRALLQGLMKSPSADEAENAVEARALGYEYAALGHRYSLNSVDAARAFLFFRNLLLEGVFAVYESASVRSSTAWGEMLRKINAFTDQILLTLLESYETYPHSNP